jgi:hypothetical protein
VNYLTVKNKNGLYKVYYAEGRMNKNKLSILVVQGLDIFISYDKEGYVSLSTDGYKPKHDKLVKFIDTLKSLQDEDDLECQEMLNNYVPGFR